MVTAAVVVAGGWLVQQSLGAPPRGPQIEAATIAPDAVVQGDPQTSRIDGGTRTRAANERRSERRSERQADRQADRRDDRRDDRREDRREDRVTPVSPLPDPVGDDDDEGGYGDDGGDGDDDGGDDD